MALANRKLARFGGDPLSENAAPTASHLQPRPPSECSNSAAAGAAGGTPRNWWRSMERQAFPRLGRRPVSEVNTADMLEILTPIWHIKAETARAVRQRIRSVLE